MILSIIIPYYNRPEPLERLIKALEPQLVDEVEVIIVDDHSPEPIKIDLPKQVRVIRLEENSGGASIPRNVGLDNAKGKYIAFIDSDDMVKPNYIKKILAKTRESWDYCYISWECSSRTVIIKTVPPSWNRCVWNCIYKRELIGKTRFRADLKIAEDYFFNLEVRKGERANIFDVLYYYEQFSPDSLTNAGITYNEKYKEK